MRMLHITEVWRRKGVRERAPIIPRSTPGLWGEPGLRLIGSLGPGISANAGGGRFGLLSSFEDLDRRPVW
jgi:hypothetical protein